MLSSRANLLKPPVTIELSARIREMRKAGADIISLNIGEPDFPPPAAAEEGVLASLRLKQSKYGPVPGFPELREAICRKLEQDNDLHYTPEEICVSAGTKQAIFNALSAICGPGDEILIPSPCWVSYEAMIHLCGATPVPVYLRMEDGFALDVDAIARHISPRTRGIIINTPNNPTGAVYSKDALRALVELAVKHDFWIISDEIYEKILFGDNRHFSVAAISSEARERCITTNGFSKAFAIPGWRVGYSAAPRSVAKVISSIQGHTTSAATSLAQWGAYYALNDAKTCVPPMVAEYEARMKLMGQKLDEIPDLRFHRPQGTFYYFVDVRAYCGRNGLSTSGDLAAYLLEHAQVATVPGEAFDLGGYLRLSFSNSQENIIKGIDRLALALRELKKE